MSEISVCTNCGVMADFWDNCVRNFCVYCCDVVAYLWDSCVGGDFCVYYCGVVADFWDNCVRYFCVYYSDIVADLWDSCVGDFCVGISVGTSLTLWLIPAIPVSRISVCTTVV